MYISFWKKIVKVLGLNLVGPFCVSLIVVWWCLSQHYIKNHGLVTTSGECRENKWNTLSWNILLKVQYEHFAILQILWYYVSSKCWQHGITFPSIHACCYESVVYTYNFWETWLLQWGGEVSKKAFSWLLPSPVDTVYTNHTFGLTQT